MNKTNEQRNKDVLTQIHYKRLLNRIDVVSARIATLSAMTKEISINSGRHPMSHDVRQRVMFDIAVEEQILRAEYFVLNDSLMTMDHSASND